MNTEETDKIIRVILARTEKGWVIAYVRRKRWLDGRPAHDSPIIETAVYQDEEQARRLAQIMADLNDLELEEEDV